MTLKGYQMQILDFNPWWKSQQVPKELVGMPRQMQLQVLPFMDYRQLILLFGIRRADKVTLMHQLMDHLLREENMDPLSFDEFLEFKAPPSTTQDNNYSTNRLTSEKKLKRVYLSNSGLLSALNPESEGNLGVFLENYFANWLKTRFFFQIPAKRRGGFYTARSQKGCTC
jgi:predicted AAA+ superfamily ATPase